MNIELDPLEAEVISKAAKQQYESLKRLYYKYADEEALCYVEKMISEKHITEEDYTKALIDRANVYLGIKKEPLKVLELTEKEMLCFFNVISILGNCELIEHRRTVLSVERKLRIIKNI